MPNDFYNASGVPADVSEVVSAAMRTELAAVAAGFNKLPTLTGNANKIVYVNASGSALDVFGNAQAAVTFLTTPSSANLAALLSDKTGSGSAVFANSPTLVTPVLGAATGTSLALGGGTALTTTNRTGTGNLVLDTSPTLTTPDIGAATATSVNGLTFANSIEGAGGSGVLAGISVSSLNSDITNGVALGDSTLVGANSVAVGKSASADNLSVAVGKSATCGYGGSTSVVVGASSGRTGASGTGNVVIGYGSATALTTGSNNTIVGKTSGTSLTSGINNSLVGNSAAASSATVSNEITLGNSSIATLRCQVTSITSLSDVRDKTGVVPLPSGIDTVMALNPVRFTWNMRDGGKVGIKDVGFIAQDLQTVDDEYLRLVYAENPEKLEASYGRLIPVLVKAIQELQQQINELKGATP